MEPDRGLNVNHKPNRFDESKENTITNDAHQLMAKTIGRWASCFSLIFTLGHSNQCRQVVVGWVDFSLFQSKCTVAARILHGHTGCTGGFPLQNPTRDTQTICSKIAVFHYKTAI